MVYSATSQLPASHEKLEVLRQATKQDPWTSSLLILKLFRHGWPSRKELLWCKNMWSKREDMRAETKLDYFKDALIVPLSQREEIYKQLHRTHRYIVRTKLLAAKHYYWPDTAMGLEYRIGTVKLVKIMLTLTSRNL